MKLAALLACTACGFSGHRGVDTPDASPDALDVDAVVIDAPPGCWMISDPSTVVCPVLPLLPRVDLPVLSIETGGGLECLTLTPASSDVCAIGATTLTLPAFVGAHGPRPLVLIGDTIEIAGTLDVASHIM